VARNDIANATSTNGTGTSAVLTKPTGTVAGVFLVAQVAVEGSATITAPSGWTLVNSFTASGLKSSIYYRMAGASEGSTYTWTFNSSQQYEAKMVPYYGISLTLSLTASTGATFAAASTNIGPLGTLTSLVPGSIELFFAATPFGTTYTPPSTPAGFEELYDRQSGSGSGHITIGLFERFMSAAGATGAVTATQAASTTRVGHHLILRPTLGRTVPVTAVLSASGTFTRTVPVEAVLQRTSTRTVPTTAVLLKSLSRSVPTTAVLQKSASRSVPVDAALVATKSRTVPTTAVLLATLSRSVPTTAVLLATLSRSVPATAVLIGTYSRSVPVTAVLELPGATVRYVPVTAVLSRHAERTVPVEAVLSRAGSRTVPTTAVLLAHGQRTIPATAVLIATRRRLVPVTAVLSGTSEPAPFTLPITSSIAPVGGPSSAITPVGGPSSTITGGRPTSETTY
jgi:hypothetical protein